MQLKITPSLLQLLQRSASDAGLPQDLRAAAAEAAASGSGGAVAWDTVKALVQRAQQNGDASVSLEQLCRGGGIAFPTPRKPSSKPPELQKRLDELRARLEQQQYDRMVADVTQEERKAKAASEGGLVTYKQQISFGLHVVAMMAAFYAFGHVAAMAITRNRAVHPFVGLAFMVGALLLETTLFIIRTSVPPKLHAAAARRATAVRVARQQEAFKQEMAAEAAAAGAAGGAAGGGGGAASGGGGGSRAKGGSAAAAAAEPKPAAEKKED